MCVVHADKPKTKFDAISLRAKLFRILPRAIKTRVDISQLISS